MLGILGGHQATRRQKDTGNIRSLPGTWAVVGEEGLVLSSTWRHL